MTEDQGVTSERDERVVVVFLMHESADDRHNPPIPVVALSQHEDLRAADRAEIEQLQALILEMSRAGLRVKIERDAALAKIAERDALLRDVTNIAEAAFYMPVTWHQRVMNLDLSGEAGETSRLNAAAQVPEAGGVQVVPDAAQWPTTPGLSERPSDDDLWDQTLSDRDGYHESADKLTAAIAAHFGEDFGEHSNLNDPWANALTFMAELEAQQVPEDVRRLREALRDARELIEHGDFREGYCMCGISVDSHTILDGHSPTDAGAYYAGQIMERIDAVLSAQSNEKEG